MLPELFFQNLNLFQNISWILLFGKIKTFACVYPTFRLLSETFVSNFVLLEIVSNFHLQTIVHPSQ